MNPFERVLYAALFRVGLGWQYNKLKCWLGVYHQYQDGRCGYCGLPHGLFRR